MRQRRILKLLETRGQTSQPCRMCDLAEGGIYCGHSFKPRFGLHSQAAKIEIWFDSLCGATVGNDRVALLYAVPAVDFQMSAALC
eukprot:3101074-Prymnesium_polylepis.2